MGEGRQGLRGEERRGRGEREGEELDEGEEEGVDEGETEDEGISVGAMERQSVCQAPDNLCPRLSSSCLSVSLSPSHAHTLTLSKLRQRSRSRSCVYCCTAKSTVKSNEVSLCFLLAQLNLPGPE